MGTLGDPRRPEREVSVASGDSMRGKTVVVTGATSGIGEVTARELARMGARVVIVGRSSDRIRETMAKIAEAVPGVTLESAQADLSVLAEVRRLAASLSERLDRIDVLVNNAGAMFDPRAETDDGIERTFALNHLSYFALTDGLLPLLKQSAPSRIVVVASDAHRACKGLEFDDLESKRRYSAFPAYCASKLANVLFARELARRLEGTGVTVNALHPGFVSTRFFTGKGLLGFGMRAAAKVAAISPEQGAKTSIFLASSPAVEGTTGGYFAKTKAVEPSKAAQDDEAARRLWEVSERMIAEAPSAPQSGRAQED